MLLYHIIRLLSRDRGLDRVMNLSKEIAVLLREADHKAAEAFKDENFLLKLCYLLIFLDFLMSSFCRCKDQMLIELSIFKKFMPS